MNRKGFTLTEVLIVIVIAAILVFLVIPNGLRAMDSANRVKHRNNLNSINSAAKLCYSETRNWTLCNTPSQLETPADGGSFITWPDNPYSGASYTLTADSTTLDPADVRAECSSCPTGAPVN